MVHFRSGQDGNSEFARYEKEQRSRILQYVVIVLFFAAVLLLIYNIQFHSTLSMISLSLVALMCIMAFFLNRAGSYVPGAILAAASTLLAITFNVYDGYGLFDSGVVAYPIFIILGTMLLGKSSVFAFMGSSLVSLFLIGYLQAHGFIHVNARASKIGGLIPISILIALAALIIRSIMSANERHLQTVRQAQRHLEQFSMGTFEGLNIVDGSTILECNQQLADMFDYSIDELRGMDTSQLVAPEDHPLLVESRRDMLKIFELTGLRKDGSRFPVQVRRRPMEYFGKPVHVAAIRDITKERADEAMRRATERRYRDLVENVGDWVVTLNPDGTVSSLNQAFEKLTGFPAAEWIGRPLVDLAHPDDGDEIDQRLGAVAGGAASVQLECRIRRVDQSYRVVEIVSSPFFDGGTLVSILGIGRDITERRNLEEQLRRMQRLESLGAIAGGIAHDLNNILSPILTASQLLRMSSKSSDEGEIISILERSARRGSEIVRQVLTFGRGQSTDVTEVNVRYAIREILSIIGKTFPKSMVVESQVGRDTGLIRGNMAQLQQVFMNLAVNARDAMPNGGTITFAATNVALADSAQAKARGVEPGTYVEITVADTGEGIPMSVLDHIFEPFFTTKEKGRGTGLGLTTVASIVREHDGVISVTSEVGHGSTFHILFPLESLPAGEEEEDSVANLPRGNGERVLIVDDELSILQICREALEAYGYAVSTARNGIEAINQLSVEAPGTFHVVLTDLNMPTIDGGQVVKVATRLDPTIAVITMSGSDTSAEVLQKPFTAETLLARIHEAVGARSNRISST